MECYCPKCGCKFTIDDEETEEETEESSEPEEKSDSKGNLGDVAKMYFEKSK